MEQLTNALQEALNNNATETTRWETYRKENETAIENLNDFAKRLTVDVMVPVGRKAFMPGTLIHTNEVLVGHYQGYFSKCTAYKAEEVCRHRIQMADQHLKELETEAQMWQNRLDKPYQDGVLPNGDLVEIVEEYNEKNEERWREAHKLNLKRTRLQEAAEKVEVEKDKDIFSILNEYELLEELEEYDFESGELNVETLHQLMSGEIPLPPSKTRVALKAKGKEKHETEIQKATAIKPLPGVVKKTDLNLQSVRALATNNNFQPNPAIQQNSAVLDGNELDDDSEMPQEVRFIKEQAKFLSLTEAIGFYDYQIEIFTQKLNALQLPKDQNEINEKFHLYAVLECLSELQEFAEELLDDEGLTAKADADSEKSEQLAPLSPTGANNINKQRRISFALEDQTLEFRDNEPVTQMLYKPAEEIPLNTAKLQRDIIRLDDDDAIINNFAPEPKNASSKKERILEKVTKNLSYVAENQSIQDSDVVNRIINAATDSCKTFYINFQHSMQKTGCDDISQSTAKCVQEEVLPGTPADFYQLYVKALEHEIPPTTTIFVNGYEGEDKVKTPVLRENIRQQVYEDPKTKYSNPNAKKNSILRNKVEQKNKNRKTKKAELLTEYKLPLPQSAYEQVMGDVVENTAPQLLSAPEPLPTGDFIDAHTPKRRVSRFKQMRADAAHM